jgi:hypothetical protein
MAGTPKTRAMLTVPELCAELSQQSARAPREYAFKARRRAEALPEVASILWWVRDNTLFMAAWEDASTVEQLLRAVGTRLDGTSCAASSVKRSRRMLNVAVEYAIKKRTLRENTLPKRENTVAEG